MGKKRHLYFPISIPLYSECGQQKYHRSISCACDFDRKRKYFRITVIIAVLKISFMLVATSLGLTVWCINTEAQPWLVWLSWLGIVLQTKKSQVRCLVRAHA